MIHEDSDQIHIERSEIVARMVRAEREGADKV